MKGTGDLSAQYAILPPGKHGLPKEFIRANQKARLFAGFAIAVANSTLRDVTVGDVVKAARVSRRTFYDLVPNMDTLASDFLQDRDPGARIGVGLSTRTGDFASAVESHAAVVASEIERGGGSDG